MKYAYINGTLLDGTKDMTAKDGLAILTDGEKIVDIVKSESDLSEYEIIDLKGKYIMPGLINMHIHLPSSGKPSKKQKDLVKLVKIVTSNALLRTVARKICESAAHAQLMSGVTTIRTMGGIINCDTEVRNRINSKKIDGPRVLASNMAISVEGGHMAGSLAYIAESAEDAKNYVDIIAKDNPDIIKLMITGGVLDAKVKGEPGELKMPAEFVKAACDEAHKLGLKVAAHVESPQGVKVALENGVDTIEHGAQPDDEMIELFKQHGASHITTISPALPYALFDREINNTTETEQYNGNIVFQGIINCAKECIKNGIPVGLGTDTGCPYITHYDMWRELVYFKKYCGVSNAFALYCATLGNAEIAQIDDVTGSIEKGKCADFVVTEKNPLDDLHALRNISMVVAKGKVFDNPKVKKMANVERELDKFI